MSMATEQSIQPALAVPNERQQSEAASLSRADGVLVLLVVLVAPIVLYLGNAAPATRLLYPLSNFALAGYLFARRSPWYAAHCLLVFCCVSLVRRLADQQAGWDPENPVLLTPYLCCLFAGLGFLDYWKRPVPRYIGPFLVLAGGIAYGAVLAIVQGRMLSTIVDVMKWSVGPLFAVYVLANHDRIAQMRSVFESCLVWAGASMAAYGIAQFIDPPIWDITWMRGAAELGLDSIGQPEPFGVRVFSTLNSPGSLGIVLSAAIVCALKRRLPASVFTITLMIVGLALCQYRSIWAATVLAVLMVVLSRKAAVRMSNIVALIVAGLVLCSSAAVPRIREAVAQRASTLSVLERDASLQSRLAQYASLARQDNLVAGQGLAINGSVRRLDRELPVHLDGAIIEIWLALGIVVGTAFLGALAALLVPLFGVAAAPGSDIFYDRAIVITLFLQLPIGTVHVGELGFCAWTFLGLALGARLATGIDRAEAQPC